MNKNKGFIGIGLILAIILGIVVIGGGAYYLGKSSDTKKEVKTEENNLPNNSEVNQNQPVVDNNQQVNTTTPTTPPVLTDCTSSSTPSIKVLYPNGGEVYTVGQNVTFKWKTCNVPSSVHISAQIIGENSSSESLAFLCEGGASTWGPECLNDGEQRLETSRPGIFKINISTRERVEVSDMSDNYFTINSATILKTGESGESGDDVNGKHIGYIKSIDSKNNLSIDYVQWVSPCVACMNGFDVVNDNTKLRSFPILDTAQIKLQTYSHNSSGGFNWNQVVSLPIFKNALNSNLLYWVTLKDGKVIEITEQYRP